MMKNWHGTLLTGVLASSSLAMAADKSQFNLFNPTPREAMREMSTDRPDLTESAYTVDAGHFQFEMDLVSYFRDRRNPAGDIRTDAWLVAPVNLKIGVANWADLQVIVFPWNYVETDDRTTGAHTVNEGFGDIVTRFKINLWGNDGDSTALAVMPFITLPTSQDSVGNRLLDGGVVMQSGIAWARDKSGGGPETEFVNSITFGREVLGDLAGYVEFFTLVGTEAGSAWQGYLDMGFTYALNENTQLDCGVNIGVTTAANDWNPFLGISWRY
jgi:hypothetical protein